MPRVEFGEPGYDPTGEPVSLRNDAERPRVSGCLMVALIFALLVGIIGFSAASLLSSASAGAVPTMADTIAPPTLTHTATPDETDAPRLPAPGIPSPEPTVAPTETAFPTAQPGMLMTWTPGPWMLTRFHTGE